MNILNHGANIQTLDNTVKHFKKNFVKKKFLNYQIIYRAFYLIPPLVGNMRVNLHCLAALMSQKFLDVPQIYPLFQQMCGKGTQSKLISVLSPMFKLRFMPRTLASEPMTECLSTTSSRAAKLPMMLSCTMLCRMVTLSPMVTCGPMMLLLMSQLSPTATGGMKMELGATGRGCSSGW